LVPFEEICSITRLKPDASSYCGLPFQDDNSDPVIRKAAEQPIFETVKVETSHRPQKRTVRSLIQGRSHGHKDYPRSAGELPELQD
jgi:hypothetical protein